MSAANNSGECVPYHVAFDPPFNKLIGTIAIPFDDLRICKVRPPRCIFFGRTVHSFLYNGGARASCRRDIQTCTDTNSQSAVCFVNGAEGACLIVVNQPSTPKRQEFLSIVVSIIITIISIHQRCFHHYSRSASSPPPLSSSSSSSDHNCLSARCPC